MAERDDNAARLERLIAAQEAQTNMLGRLVQVLERQETKKRIKATRVPRPVNGNGEPDAVSVAAAERALQRLKASRA
jgi:hypothetical protein